MPILLPPPCGRPWQLQQSLFVWEKTIGKELHARELTSKVGYLQNLPITAPLGDCIENVIAQLKL